jgi:hypothetical protein
MLILYLLFPRVSGPLWGLPQDAHAGLSGLSNQMSPGSISDLILSGAIAFRSQFAGELPDKAELYWRGPVFDDYDGVTWRASRPAGNADAGAGDRGPRQPPAYTTLLEAHNQRWLLALDVPPACRPTVRSRRRSKPAAREPVRSVRVMPLPRHSTTAPTASKHRPSCSRP